MKKYLSYGGGVNSTALMIILKNEGVDFEVVYSLKYGILPSRWQRWCTDKFKITPMYKYFERPCTVYIGFHAGELKRAKPSRDCDIYNEFPLIEKDIDQQGCIDIIANAGLPVPKKSGCFFCPFSRIEQFEYIRDNKPDLWCKVKKLETTANIRRASQEKTPIYLRDKSVDAVVSEGQSDLWGIRKPCICDL